jgi:hypothetical protein
LARIATGNQRVARWEQLTGKAVINRRTEQFRSSGSASNYPNHTIAPNKISATLADEYLTDSPKARGHILFSFRFAAPFH